MPAILSRENVGTSRSQKHIQVLIISQNVRVAGLLRNIMRTLGFHSSHMAHDALEAIRFLREVRINIVISDSELPVTQPGYASRQEAGRTVHGADFVKSLRCSPSSPNPYVPVVMIAEEVQEDEVIRARDCGVNGVVLRPLEVRQLCHSIREVVETPRRFVMSETYKGPSRRRKQEAITVADRRRKDICLVRNNG